MTGPDCRILRGVLDVRGGFGHREHLELAWRYLSVYSRDDAGDAMVVAIRYVAHLHGAEQKFHETMTRAWLHFVAVHMQRWGSDDFDAFLGLNPALLDTHLIDQFYSRELIQSDPARMGWRSPDLRPLPALA
jgi:hypothetical protein